jgi:hypothetical protein
MKEEKKRVSHRQIQSSSFVAAAAQAPRVSSSKGAQASPTGGGIEEPARRMGEREGAAKPLPRR